MTLGWLTDSSTILSLLESLADNWQALGSLLGFSKPVLERINSVPAAPAVYLDRIVTKWLMSDATSSPTVSALVNALSGIEGTEQIVQGVLEGTCLLIGVYYAFISRCYVVAMFNMQHNALILIFCTGPEGLNDTWHFEKVNAV